MSEPTDTESEAVPTTHDEDDIAPDHTLELTDSGRQALRLLHQVDHPEVRP